MTSQTFHQNIESIHGLSPMQLGMLFHKMADEDSPEYVLQEVFYSTKPISREHAELSLALLSLNNE